MRRSIRKHRERAFNAEGARTAKAGGAIPLPGPSAAPARGAALPLRIFRGILQVPHTFVVMNSAAVVGLYAYFRRRKNIWVRSNETEVWETPAGSAVPMPVAQQTDSRRKAA